ncbi:hypothetical protein BX600DRAFT_471160 [Xylariales sp. PMI_506]|nr:hypothetical protein BX600DRAFT_471160 [Xylariales sp. PMI_506]
MFDSPLSALPPWPFLSRNGYQGRKPRRTPLTSQRLQFPGKTRLAGRPHFHSGGLPHAFGL